MREGRAQGNGEARRKKRRKERRKEGETENRKNAKMSTNFQKVNKHHEFRSTKMGADSTQLQFQRYVCCVILNKYHTITI